MEEFQKQTDKDTIKEVYEYLVQTGKRIPNHAKNLEQTLIRRFYNYIETSFRIANKNDFKG